ncbi:MAG: hypothetical protein P8X55_16175, partial [Desulfosarcinaceae bacterium]
MDTIETIKGSVVQHGRHNDRIYLMHFGTSDTPGLIARLDSMAEKHGYGKILAKIPAPAWKPFRSADYCQEALVPGFFKGRTDGLFIAKYFSAARQSAQPQKIPLKPSAGHRRRTAERPSHHIEPCRPADAGEMAALYRKVFKTYPLPIR